MPTTEFSPPGQQTNPSKPAPSGGHQMDSRMMWVMMIGCCLAIPIALVVVRHRTAGAHCDTSSDRHG